MARRERPAWRARSTTSKLDGNAHLDGRRRAPPKPTMITAYLDRGRRDGPDAWSCGQQPHHRHPARTRAGDVGARHRPDLRRRRPHAAASQADGERGASNSRAKGGGPGADRRHDDRHRDGARRRDGHQPDRHRERAGRSAGRRRHARRSGSASATLRATGARGSRAAERRRSPATSTTARPAPRAASSPRDRPDGARSTRLDVQTKPGLRRRRAGRLPRQRPLHRRREIDGRGAPRPSITSTRIDSTCSPGDAASRAPAPTSPTAQMTVHARNIHAAPSTAEAQGRDATSAAS